VRVRMTNRIEQYVHAEPTEQSRHRGQDVTICPHEDHPGSDAS
jgi:hypothetical protein